MKIAIVNYGCGNIASICNMLQYLSVEADVVDSPECLSFYDMLILPGVGHFNQGMKNIISKGFKDPLDSFAYSGKPILGICLGMQLMTARSEEGGVGLGWFSCETKRFKSTLNNGDKLLVPHMGWNYIRERGEAKYFGLKDKFYFVHSYYVNAEGTDELLASCSYGDDSFSCVIKKGNLIGVQFHPEKSHQYGVCFFKKYFSDYGVLNNAS